MGIQSTCSSSIPRRRFPHLLRSTCVVFHDLDGFPLNPSDVFQSVTLLGFFLDELLQQGQKQPEGWSLQAPASIPPSKIRGSLRPTYEKPDRSLVEVWPTTAVAKEPKFAESGSPQPPAPTLTRLSSRLSCLAKTIQLGRSNTTTTEVAW